MKSQKLKGAKSMSTSISEASVEEAEEDHRVEYIGTISPCTIIFGSPYSGRATKIVLEKEARLWGQEMTGEKLTSDHAVYIDVGNKVIELHNEPRDITNKQTFVEDWEEEFGELPKYDYLVDHM